MTIDTVATITSTTVTLVVPPTTPVSECDTVSASGEEEGTAVSVGAGTAAVGEPFTVGSCVGVASVGCWIIELLTGCVG